MLEKTKTYTKYAAQNVTDIRVLGQVIFGVIVLMISWSCVQAIQTNAELQKQITQLNQQNDVRKLENENLKLQNEYLNTPQFLEIAARREFGKAAPGEKVFVVSKTVAMAKTVNLPTQTKQQKFQTQAHQPSYEQNLEAWRNFFFHSDD